MKNKITPLMIFGVLWLVVVIISWNVFPAWKKMDGGIWLLLGAAAVGVLAFLKDIKGLLETPASPDKKAVENQPVVNQPIIIQPVITQPIPDDLPPEKTDEADGRVTNIPWEARDPQLVRKYFELCGLLRWGYDKEPKQIEHLLSYGLLKNISNSLFFTKAGVLLFCKQELFPHTLLHTEIILRYETQDNTLNQQQVFFGSILKSYYEIYAVLKPLTSAWKGTNLRNEYRQEKEYFYYPNIAIEEALVNFLVHRDYLKDDKGFITIYDDRIEFCNPGTSTYGAEALMRVTWTLRPDYRRNPRLFQALARTNLNSSEGSGIKRLNDLRTRRVSHDMYGFSGIIEIKNALIENKSTDPTGEIGIFIENDKVLERFTLVIYKKVPSAPMSAIETGRKLRLLIVEDDIDIGNMVGIYFYGMSYEVFIAPRGSDGIRGCQAILPHAIILDIMLPDIDGYEICRILRSHLRTRYIPIVFLTQRDERSDKLQGLELGADDYITKPFDIEELKLRVQGLIRRSERENLSEPRTGLPGARLTEEELRHVIRTQDWAVLDIQINHFDTFKELYGFVAADYVLRFTALLINEVLDDFAFVNNSSKATSSFFKTTKDFVGHVAESNFFIITSDQSAVDIRQRLKERFLNEVQSEYKFEDRERGSMLMRKPDGGFEKVPLMYLSIGLVLSKSDLFADVHEIMQSAVQARLYDQGTTT